LLVGEPALVECEAAAVACDPSRLVDEDPLPPHPATTSATTIAAIRTQRRIVQPPI
jgi:hypothetical protein